MIHSFNNTPLDIDLREDSNQQHNKIESLVESKVKV